MSYYTLFDNNGVIQGNYWGNSPEKQSSFGFVVGHSDELTQYVSDLNNPKITDKPVNTTILDKTTVIADGVDKITLSLVPIGATVVVDSLTEIADTSTVEITFDIPGTYDVKVELFPYLPFEATVNAT